MKGLLCYGSGRHWNAQGREQTAGTTATAEAGMAQETASVVALVAAEASLWQGDMK